MTTRQKQVLALLGAANAIWMLVLVLSVFLPSGLVSLDAGPSPVPTLSGRAGLSPPCERRATEMLSEAGLGGTVALTEGTLQFTLVFPLASGESQDEVAQRAWSVFDVALALADEGCTAFSGIEVMITHQGDPGGARSHITVAMEDLRAFYAGELAESIFIDRVAYWMEPTVVGEP